MGASDSFFVFNEAALGPSSEAVGDRIARRLAEADGSRVMPMSWDEAQRCIDSDEPDR